MLAKIILLMHCTLLGVCAACGLPQRGKSHILACPLSQIIINLLAHRLTVLRFPYTLCDLLWMFANVSFSHHRNFITICCFWRTSSVVTILKVCYVRATHGNSLKYNFYIITLYKIAIRFIWYRGEGDWDFRISDLVKIPHGEFRWSRRAQLAKSTLLTYMMGSLGSFQIF